MHVVFYQLPSEQLCLFSLKWPLLVYLTAVKCLTKSAKTEARLDNMSGSCLSQNVLGYFNELRNTGRSLSILVIGEQGSGKTSIVNNLFGEEIAKEEDNTLGISTFKGTVQGVSVTVYEASSLSVEDEQGRRQVQELVITGSITFILYCFKMSETRMRQSLTDTFKVFNSAGVNWNKTVIALTFADSVPVPKAMRRDPNFNMKQHFIMRVKEWKDQVHRVLTSEVGIPMQTAGLVAMLPTTGDPDELLPTGEEWCSALWSALLAAPMLDEYAQTSVAVKRRRTTPDMYTAYTPGHIGVSEPPATRYTLPPSSGQQEVPPAKVIVALFLAVVVIGAFAFGGRVAGAFAAVGAVAIGLVSKWRGLW